MTLKTPNAVEAAREVLRWYHGRLLTLWPGPIDPELAYHLTVWRDVALLALIDHGTKGFAKREQLELTDGRPLGICTGGGEPKLVPTDWRRLQVWPSGCYFVFEEATNISGRKWPRLCPDCQPRNGHRNPDRDAERAARAGVETFFSPART